MNGMGIPILDAALSSVACDTVSNAFLTSRKAMQRGLSPTHLSVIRVRIRKTLSAKPSPLTNSVGTETPGVLIDVQPGVDGKPWIQRRRSQ